MSLASCDKAGHSAAAVSVPLASSAVGGGTVISDTFAAGLLKT